MNVPDINRSILRLHDLAGAQTRRAANMIRSDLERLRDARGLVRDAQADAGGAAISAPEMLRFCDLAVMAKPWAEVSDEV